MKIRYKKIKLSGTTIILADDFPAQSKTESCDSARFADGLRSSFEKLQSSKFANVYKFQTLFCGRVHNLILKQYLNRSFADVIKNFFRPSRAKRAFAAAVMLQKHNFFTPNLIALGSKRIAGITIRNFLITKYLKNTTSLAEVLKTINPQKQQLIAEFGKTVGRLHAENIFHGDLRLGNVLIKQNDKQFDFFFLDNERTKKFKKLPYRLRLKNLVQVNMFRHNISDNDRKCFWNAYILEQAVGLNKQELANKITAVTKKRLAAKKIKTV